MKLIIAVSGPIAVGKSSFIAALEQQLKVIRISTRELIQSLRDVPAERKLLQEAGEELDRETDGSWVAQALAARSSLDRDAVVIIDSVRIAKQIEHLRTRFGNRVTHVHLTAPQEVLSARFYKRKEAGDPAVEEFSTYEEARTNRTEAAVGMLGDIADIRIEAGDLEPTNAAAIVVEKLGL